MASITTSPTMQDIFGFKSFPTSAGSANIQSNFFGFKPPAPSTPTGGRTVQQADGSPSTIPITGIVKAGKELLPLAQDAITDLTSSAPAVLGPEPTQLLTNTSDVPQHLIDEVAAANTAKNIATGANIATAVMLPFAGKSTQQAVGSLKTAETLTSIGSKALTQFGAGGGATAGVLGSVGAAFQAAALPVAIMTGISMLNRRGAREITTDFDIVDTGVQAGATRKKRMDGYENFLKDELETDLSTLVGSTKQLGADLSDTRIVGGLQGGDRGGEIAVKLLDFYSPSPEDSANLRTELNSILTGNQGNTRGVGTKQETLLPESKLFVPQRLGQRVPAGKTQATRQEGLEEEAQRGLTNTFFIDITNKAGQQKRFYYLDVHDKLAERLPQYGEIADTSRQAAFQSAQNFLQGSVPSSPEGITRGATQQNQTQQKNVLPKGSIAKTQEDLGLRQRVVEEEEQPTTQANVPTATRRGTSFASFVDSIKQGRRG